MNTPLVSNTSKKYIIHLDGDNFFVSCELMRYPHLRNTPVVVGRERGAAVAMNGPAKKIGITRGMPVREIQKYFSGVTVLPSHFESYRTFSKRIGDIVREYSGTLEYYSIDEYFFEYETAGDVVFEMNALKDQIEATLGITVSIGISTTKVLAKLATSINKPNGVTHIHGENKIELLSKIPTDDIWGIGRRSAPLWKNRGYRYASDFLLMEHREIETCSLPVRELIYELRGIQHFTVHSLHAPQKSYQSTESFLGSSEPSFVYSEVFRHTETLCRKLWQSGGKTGYISVLLRTRAKQYQTRSITLKVATDDFRAIFEAVEMLFDTLFNASETYSKTGVTFGSIAYKKDVPQVSLFDSLSPIDEVVEGHDTNIIYEVEQAVQARFGARKVCIASAKKSYKRKEDKQTALERIDHYIYGLPLPYLGKSVN